MTKDEEQGLGERMERIEADIAEIKRALLGDLNGQGGMYGRLRAQEEQVARHDLRIVSLESWRGTLDKDAVRRTELEALTKQVGENTEFRNRIIWMVTGAAAAGAISGGGVVAVMARIIGG